MGHRSTESLRTRMKCAWAEIANARGHASAAPAYGQPPRWPRRACSWLSSSTRWVPENIRSGSRSPASTTPSRISLCAIGSQANSRTPRGRGLEGSRTSPRTPASKQPAAAVCQHLSTVGRTPAPPHPVWHPPPVVRLPYTPRRQQKEDTEAMSHTSNVASRTERKATHLDVLLLARLRRDRQSTRRRRKPGVMRQAVYQ